MQPVESTAAPHGCGRRILRGSGVAVVMLVVSGVILNNAPEPYVWIGLAWVGLCVVLMVIERSSRALWFNLGFVFLALTGAEFLLSRLDTGETHGEWDCTGSGSFFRDHEVLGYGPVPGVSCTATGYVGDEFIYEAEYTINDRGLRTTPEPPSETTRGSILFFGGSFTFGEGVDDPETLPYATGAKLAGTYAAHNFGFHGYGPHQMLAALEFGVADDIVGNEPRYAIYQAIPDHLRRVAGYTPWDVHGPKYVLAGDGEATRVGPFHEGWRLTVLEKLRRSYVFSFLEKGIGWRVGQQEVDLYVGVVDRARRLVEERYDDAEFHVVFWETDDPWTETIIEGLERRGLRVHRVADILPGSGPDDLSWVLHARNRHPNPRAYDAIAEFIAREIVRVDDEGQDDSRAQADR